jgi:WD40 repeat protein
MSDESPVASASERGQRDHQVDRSALPQRISSPLILGLFSAIFGLLGTGIGAALQGRSALQLERQKFEFSLIQKALNTEDKNEAAKWLQFYVASGIIQTLDAGRIRKIAENPQQLPGLTELLTASAGAISPSPDGKTFLVASGNSVDLFDLNGRRIKQFKGHTQDVTAVAYSPDGKSFVSGSLDKTIRLVDVASAQEVGSIDLEDGVIGLGITRDGKKVLVRTRDNKVSEYNLQTLVIEKAISLAGSVASLFVK